MQTKCALGAEWASSIENAGPDMPKVHVEITAAEISVAPTSKIGSLDWKQSLIATREMNPKPILIAHVKGHVDCKQLEASLQSISSIYQCNKLKCVLGLR